MRNLVGLIFVFFVFTQVHFAQSEQTFYTKIIEDHKSNIYPITFDEWLKLIPNKNKINRKELEIIYKVVLANEISNQKNKINNQATNYYEEALLLVKQTNNIELQLWVESQIGFYYYQFNKYDKASEFFLSTSKILNENTNLDFVDPINTLKYNAYFFTTIGEKKLSNIYLKRALTITSKNNTDYAAFLNALGNNYFDLGITDTANYYFKETIHLATQTNDSLRLAKGYGDLAQIYLRENKVQEAEKLLQKDIEISQVLKNEKNEIFAKMRLGQLYSSINNFKKAKEVYESILIAIQNQKDLQSWELKVNKALLNIAISEKSEKEELILRRKIAVLQPIVDTIDGAELLRKLSWKKENEIAKWKLELQKKELEKASLIKSNVIAISVLVLSLLGLLVFIYKKRLKLQQAYFKNEMLTAQLEQIKTQEELNEATKSLNEIKTYLIGKNHQIVKLEAQLKQIVTKPKRESKQEKLALDKLISSHLMTDENWLTFKKALATEKPEILAYIKIHFPDLSESNLRIVLLTKIGLKNQEIANLLGITIHGVKKAKQRLRIKYGVIIENLVN